MILIGVCVCDKEGLGGNLFKLQPPHPPVSSPLLVPDHPFQIKTAHLCNPYPSLLILISRGFGALILNFEGLSMSTFTSARTWGRFQEWWLQALELTFRVTWQPPLAHYILRRYVRGVPELRFTIPWEALAFQMCNEASYSGLSVNFISSACAVSRAIANRRTSLELQLGGWGLTPAGEPP